MQISTALNIPNQQMRQGFGLGASLALDFTSGNRTLDPRITFSRTTNATVTGSNGLIQYAPHNLLTFSEQFDNGAWIKNRAVVFSNQTIAPDGSLTADKLASTATASTNFAFRSFATSGGSAGTYTISVYAKKEFYSQIRVSQDAVGDCFFDLQNGTVISQTNATGLITFVGNGWYRCSITFTSVGTTGNINFSVASGGNHAFTGNGVDGIFIWGAQLEQSSTATTYNPTTVKNLLGFTEHFDNAAWTKSNSFVQTNLLLRSEEFDNAAWVKTAATVTANSTTAPDGALSADLLAEDSTLNSHIASQAITYSNGTSYTYSVYLKAHTRTHCFIVSSTSGFLNAVSVNLSTGLATTAAGSPTNIQSQAVANGWYRVSFTAVSTVNASVAHEIRLSTDGVWDNRSYTGDGTSGIFIWGAQLVQGTSAGDYKATYAAAAAVGYTDIYGQPFAQKLVETTANAQHFINSGVVVGIGANVTLSCYAKAAERKRFTLRFGSVAPTNRATFDLVTGAVVDELNASPIITPLGGGWFRCSINAVTTAAGTQTQAAYLNTDTGVATETYTGDGTSGIYIFGAQLSDSASVDPYVYQPVAAPASTAYYGPRFDYDPVTLAPKGLLIEEQRTQLFTFSEQFNDASWVKLEASITANTIVAPDGTLTGDKLVASTSNTGHYAEKVTNLVSGTAYTFSVYVKAGEYASVNLLFGSSGGAGLSVREATVNLTNGTITSQTIAGSTTVTSVANGWYRISVTTAVTTGSGSPAVRIYVNSSISSAAAGDGVSGIYVWGAQLEAGAFATSYIPSVASQVTRAADNASMIGNNFARWYNVNEGGVFADSTRFDTGVAAVYQIDDTSANNRIVLGHNVSGVPNLTVVTGGAVQAALVFGAVSANANKIAAAYKADDFAGSRDGGAVLTDTSGSVPIVSRLVIGADNTTTAYLNGNIKRIAYFNRRLANSELIGITA
jgi:hypothetical protein